MIVISFIAGFLIGVASLMILRTVLYNTNNVIDKQSAETYDSIVSKIKDAREEYYKLSDEDRAGEKGEHLRKRIEILDEVLKWADKSIGQYRTAGGNYKGGQDGR